MLLFTPLELNLYIKIVQWVDPNGIYSSTSFHFLQVRLLDGSTINTVFKAQEPLAAVRVYVQMNGNTPEGQDFTLLSPYPRHVYTELDMEKPLKELGEQRAGDWISIDSLLP